MVIEDPGPRPPDDRSSGMDALACAERIVRGVLERAATPPAASGRVPRRRPRGGTRPVLGRGHAVPRRAASRQAERTLVAAVLLDAIEALRQGRDAQDPGAHRKAVEVRAWLESGDASWPFSFVSTCDALALDAEVIRGLLR